MTQSHGSIYNTKDTAQSAPQPWLPHTAYTATQLQCMLQSKTHVLNYNTHPNLQHTTQPKKRSSKTLKTFARFGSLCAHLHFCPSHARNVEMQT